jgi:hypothetical protein
MGFGASCMVMPNDDEPVDAIRLSSVGALFRVRVWCRLAVAFHFQLKKVQNCDSQIILPVI